MLFICLYVIFMFYMIFVFLHDFHMFWIMMFSYFYVILMCFCMMFISVYVIFRRLYMGVSLFNTPPIFFFFLIFFDRPNPSKCFFNQVWPPELFTNRFVIKNHAKRAIQSQFFFFSTQFTHCFIFSLIFLEKSVKKGVKKHTKT